MNPSIHAAYSIYHETMRLFWPEWRRRVDRADIDGNLRDLGIHAPDYVGPMELGAAIRSLSQRRRLFSVHAAAALSACHWALSGQDQVRIDPTPEMRKNLGLIGDFLATQQVETRHVEAMRTRSAMTLSQAFLAPINLLGCELSDFWVNLDAGLGTGETTCGAGVAVRRPAADLRARLNPELWQDLVPDFFETTYRTGGSPSDPDQAPNPLPSADEPLTTWHDYLFETASWPLPPNFKVRVRNLLNVDFDQSAPTKQVCYSLRECLTGELAAEAGAGETSLFRAYGGIDRDSGFIDVRPVPDNPDFTSFSGLKSIRFTKHLSFLNVMTPGYLLFWLSLQILGGACYSEHPGLFS